MGVKERLREYIKTLNISEREFCRQIGVSSSYVNNIRQSIQPDKMKAIGEKFPELNPMWLLTGDGTMRNGDNTNRISGNNNTAVAGNGNQVTTNDIAGLIELQKGYQEMIKEKDSQIARLIYLEWEELFNLYSFKFPPSRSSLEAVRDVFCFCCFTGLRYSDVAKLRRSDVKKDYISVVTQKTVDGLIIELNKYSRAILKKYENIGLPNDKALPVISNVKMNEHLKVMGEMAGIDEPTRVVYFKGNVRHEEVLPKYALLTTHCGRRTFIINALRLGVPAEVIMKWTGHSDYKAMKPYIKIVDKLKVAEMDKFNKFPIPRKKGK